MLENFSNIMKRSLIFRLVLIFAACKSGSKNENQTVPVEAATSAHSAVFNQSFEKILINYYQLRDAFVASDTTKANQATTALIAASDSLNLDELKKADTSNVIVSTAKSYTGTISSEGKGLIGESDIEAKRKEFQMISGALFDLIRTVRYDRQKIYLLNCPMAFDQQGADWLSSTTDIHNPYFGSKMPDCGNVKDSIVLK